MKQTERIADFALSLFLIAATPIVIFVCGIVLLSFFVSGSEEQSVPRAFCLWVLLGLSVYSFVLACRWRIHHHKSSVKTAPTVIVVGLFAGLAFFVAVLLALNALAHALQQTHSHGPALDGVLEKSFKDMCAEANGTPPDFSKHTTHRENRNMMRKVTGGGSNNRAGTEKPAVNGTSRTVGGATKQDSHHGPAKYIQDHLCPKVGAPAFPAGCTQTGEHANRIHHDCAPAIILPKRLHVGSDPKSIHGLLNKKQLAWQTLKASKRTVGGVKRTAIPMSDILTGMAAAYGDAELDCFGALSIKWLQTYFDDCK